MSAPPNEPVRIQLLDVPEMCGSCGYGDQAGVQWPLGAYGGRLFLVCPDCNVFVAPIVAVPAT